MPHPRSIKTTVTPARLAAHLAAAGKPRVGIQGFRLLNTNSSVNWTNPPQAFGPEEYLDGNRDLRCADEHLEKTNYQERPTGFWTDRPFWMG